MMTSGTEVAKQVGILKPVIRPQARFPISDSAPAGVDLVADGSVRRLVVKPEGCRAQGR